MYPATYGKVWGADSKKQTAIRSVQTIYHCKWVPDTYFTPANPGSGAAQAFNIWGYIPAITGTQPGVGSYKDTVVITIDY